jgi:hypothetical protein
MMESNDINEWIHFVCKSYLEYTLNEKDGINFDLINTLLNRVPVEFRGHDFFTGLKQLSSDARLDYINLHEEYSQCHEANGVDRVIIESIRNRKDDFKIENSIFKHFVSLIDFKPLETVLCIWLEETVNIFEFLKNAFEKRIVNSINPAALVNKELDNLDIFFDSGLYTSKVQHGELATEELFKYYNTLLFGIAQSVIRMEDLYEFEKAFKQKSGATKIEIFNEILQDSLPKEWWLSIRVQVLLWMKDYLGELKATNDYTNVFLKHKASNPFVNLDVNDKGFQVSNPNKTIPALYNELIEHSLIRDEGLDKFRAAFIDAKGYIEWITIQSQLGYFVQEIKNHGIVTTNNNWKTAQVIFLVKGRNVNGSSIKSGASQITAPPKKVINSIIKKILSLH